MAERSIHTIKDMLYKRIEHNPSLVWYGEVLQQVIFIYILGRVHSTIEMTPNNAKKASNESTVQANIREHSKLRSMT